MNHCAGDVCDGSGVVLGPPQHALDCTPLQCAKGCGRRPPAPCPACAEAALSEDLGTP